MMRRSASISRQKPVRRSSASKPASPALLPSIAIRSARGLIQLGANGQIGPITSGGSCELTGGLQRLENPRSENRAPLLNGSRRRANAH